MTSEKKTQIKVILKLLVVVIFAFLYAAGGTENMGGKWLRRFLAPAILCLSAFGFSRDWRYFVQMPMMFITLSFGYGADSVIGKILRRCLFGALNGTSSSTVNIWYRKWILVGFQVALITAAYIVFGVWNPLPSTRAEETLLGALIALIPMMSVKDYDKK